MIVYYTSRHMDYGQTKAVSRHAVVPEIIQAQIIEAIAGIRYGAVEIVIHVVQIERKEKVRFERPS